MAEGNYNLQSVLLKLQIKERIKSRKGEAFFKPFFLFRIIIKLWCIKDNGQTLLSGWNFKLFVIILSRISRWINDQISRRVQLFSRIIYERKTVFFSRLINSRSGFSLDVMGALSRKRTNLISLLICKSPSTLLCPSLFRYLCFLCWLACQSSRPLEDWSNLVILPKRWYCNYVASAA